jgi:arginyl-tRNA--protein-N-Asp/Glu arginylyltransferase
MIYFKDDTLTPISSYHVPYEEWGIPENSADIVDLYQTGYLPYSLDKKEHPLYYRCRSSRVVLKDFSLSSENRRVLRKVQEIGLDLHFEKITGKEALLDAKLLDLFIDYYSERHGDAMPMARLKAVLIYSEFVWVYVCRQNGELIGAVIVQELKKCSHYWFSAYDLKYFQGSLGLGLILGFLNQLKAEGVFEYAFLGTLYGKKAMYKTNIEQLEYFDGETWVRDLKKLKEQLVAFETN